MAFFISHVGPLWSFAAPRPAMAANGRRDAGCVHARGPAVWIWVRGEDGRPQRRWAGGAGPADWRAADIDLSYGRGL
jgi:hypothetical protein